LRPRSANRTATILVPIRWPRRSLTVPSLPRGF
jgi:hypothetical protein